VTHPKAGAKLKAAVISGSPRLPEPAAEDDAAQETHALKIAASMGLLDGPKTKHFNAKVPPALFDAAARRLGTSSPAKVIIAALASLATEDDVGKFLARNWGTWADVAPEILDEMEF